MSHPVTSTRTTKSKRDRFSHEFVSAADLRLMQRSDWASRFREPIGWNIVLIEQLVSGFCVTVPDRQVCIDIDQRLLSILTLTRILAREGPDRLQDSVVEASRYNPIDLRGKRVSVVSGFNLHMMLRGEAKRFWSAGRRSTSANSLHLLVSHMPRGAFETGPAHQAGG